jgi:CubicO group peptidase (beta-lactamase class C family)
MRKSLAALSIVLVLATAPAGGQDTPAFTPFGIIPVLDAYLESLRQQAGIPGMSAALVRDGEVIWTKGYGFENLTSRVRTTPDTPYLVGDISGTVAAALLLQCVVEHRRHDLDTPFRRYPGLTDFPEPDATLREVLSHTSSDPGAEPFVYNPGRYAQLTQVMEWCAPQPYRKSVAHRILNYLAMGDSVPGLDLQNPELPLPEGLFEPSHLERYRSVIGRLAVPYKVEGRGRAQVTEIAPASITAADGLISTVRDLAKFDGALDAGLVVTRETLDLAWTPVLGHRGSHVPMGLGWFVQSHRGQRVVWHFSHVPNAYSALMLKVPERKITLILLANSDGLTAPFQLSRGDVTRSLFAAVFLRLVT